MEENKHIADTLSYQSQLMEVAGRDSRRVSVYRSAGTALRKLGQPVRELAEADELGRLKGIGPGIETAIKSILHTGSDPHVASLEAEIPPGVRDMLDLSGLSSKKVAFIWREMGIASLGELYYACLENRFVKVKGFGEKVQEGLLKALGEVRKNRRQFLYADLYPHWKQMEAVLDEAFGEDRRILLTGEMRRLCPIVERIQFVAAPGLYRSIMLLLVQHPDYELLTAATDLLQASVRGTRISFDFLFGGADFFKELFTTTGSAAHVERIPLENEAFYESEEDIYKVARISYVPPELREGAEEVRLAYRDNLPRLVHRDDVKGLLHVHSSWSDGSNSIVAMAEAAQALGMAYLGLSDHSQSAVFANGLSPERVKLQLREIDDLNRGFKDFRILKGIESDILEDGGLDYTPHELSGFDFVIASVHTGLEMDRDTATERLLTAVRNPFTNILGHPTGRLLLAREGYPLDHKAVIEACAEFDVAIELNANPHRLDLDWRWVRYAVECGVYVAVNPDAHSTEALKDYLWGINVARKGLLPASLTLNAMPLDEIEEFFMQKRKRRIV